MILMSLQVLLANPRQTGFARVANPDSDSRTEWSDSPNLKKLNLNQDPDSSNRIRPQACARYRGGRVPSPSGLCFLTYDSLTGFWYEVGARQLVLKTGQCVTDFQYRFLLVPAAISRSNAFYFVTGCR